MATRLTNYKTGAMTAAKLTQKPKGTSSTAAGHKSKDLPEIPPVTLRAAKAAHNLPANVIDQAIRVTRKRYALYNPSVNVKRLRGAELKSTLEKFLLSRAPDTTLKDDWLVVADDYWLQGRHPYRLSIAIVLAGKAVLNSPRALKWRHVLDGDWPTFPTPYKEQNGLPTITYIPNPPPPVVVVKPIPVKPGIKINPTPTPTLADIRAESDPEFCRFLQTVFLPAKQHFEPFGLETNAPQPQTETVVYEPPTTNTAADLLARMTPVDDDGLIDPLALLLKPVAPSDTEAADADLEHDDDYDTEN